jgi:hypothetical protein
LVARGLTRLPGCSHLVIGCLHGGFNQAHDMQKEVTGKAPGKRWERPFPASQARKKEARMRGPACRLTKAHAACN